MTQNEVQVVSDVHCDLRRSSVNIRAVAPTLLVAGDVDSHADPAFRDYLRDLFAGHEHGVYVPGNHDYWGATAPFDKVVDYIERVCRSLDGSVYVLREGNWGYDVPDTNTRIVGATLWTRVPNIGGPQPINDFQYIRMDRTHTMMPIDMNLQHEIDKSWIARSIARATDDGKKCLVATHHCPDAALAAHNNDKSCNGLGEYYFNFDMQDVMSLPGIVAWAYGHTHESRVTRMRSYGYPFVTNAMGYPRENTGYAEGVTVSVV